MRGVRFSGQVAFCFVFRLMCGIHGSGGFVVYGVCAVFISLGTLYIWFMVFLLCR